MYASRKEQHRYGRKGAAGENQKMSNYRAAASGYRDSGLSMVRSVTRIDGERQLGKTGRARV